MKPSKIHYISIDFIDELKNLDVIDNNTFKKIKKESQKHKKEIKKLTKF